MALFDKERWVLETALTQEECVRRLKTKVRGMWKTTPTPDQPLIGDVTRSGFALQFHATMAGHDGANPFYFRGEFVPGTARTTIRATYGVSIAYRVFIAGLVSFFLYVGWRISPFYLANLPAALQAFFGMAMFFFVYYCVQSVGWINRFAKAERDPIIGTVADILEAQVSEAPPE